MEILKYPLFGICVYLWYLGGGKRAWARDIIIPVLLSFFIAFYTRTWWMFFIGFPLQSIKIGYGAYDQEHDDKPSFLAKITKDRQGKWIRLIWGIIVSLSIGSSLFFGGFLAGSLYGIYILINALVNFSVCHFSMNREWTDFLVGSAVCSIIFMIK